MNINYNPESVTDKGMPTAYDLLSPVLKQVNKHPYKTLGIYTNLVVKAINLPDELASMHYKTGHHDFIIKKRISWALTACFSIYSFAAQGAALRVLASPSPLRAAFKAKI